MNDQSIRVRWIFGALMIPLIFTGCASLGEIFAPGVTDPGSPGGEEITKEESEKIVSGVKTTTDALAAILTTLGLPGIAAGIGVAGSVGGNFYQMSKNRDWRDAAEKYARTIEVLKESLTDLDVSEEEAKEIILKALRDSGADKGRAKKVYRYLKDQGLI